MSASLAFLLSYLNGSSVVNDVCNFVLSGNKTSLFDFPLVETSKSIEQFEELNLEQYKKLKDSIFI